MKQLAHSIVLPAQEKALQGYLDLADQITDWGTLMKLVCLPRKARLEIGEVAGLSRQAQELTNQLDGLLSERLNHYIGSHLHEISFEGGG